MGTSKRIVLVIFDAGGGHRAAAQALTAAIEQQGRPWQVDLLNLQEVLDPIDPLLKIAGIRIQDFYNLILRTGMTLGAAQLLRVLHGAIGYAHPRTVVLFKKRWGGNPPDLVASLIPHFNASIHASLAQHSPETPFVTILTDLADYPPHFWIEPQKQFVICGTDRAVEQASQCGHPPERVFRASGMILHPRFYEPCLLDRAVERQKLGLKPDLPTGLVMFGGQGARVMLKIVERLDGSRLPLQLIAICGRNQRLVEKLKARKWLHPMLVMGFTTDVPYYMRLADFFIGKPGPGSISEAVAMKLPVIVQSNSWTLPQERYNTQWVEETGVGVATPSFERIGSVVESLLNPPAFARFKSNVEAQHNRAVFEIPDMLEQIMEGSPLHARTCVPQAEGDAVSLPHLTRHGVIS